MKFATVCRHIFVDGDGALSHKPPGPVTCDEPGIEKAAVEDNNSYVDGGSLPYGW